MTHSRTRERQRMISHPVDLDPIDTQERIVLYPTFGYWAEGRWSIPICGTVYHTGKIGIRKRLLVKLFQRVLKLPPAQIDNEVFQRRIHAFVSRTKRGRRIVVGVGDRQFRLQRGSKKSGYFRGTLHVTEQQLAELESRDFAGESLELKAFGRAGDEPRTTARARLIPQDGVSVISDIDDTMKHTCVNVRQELLANSFLRPFVAIEGIAEVYRRWASSGVAFHYVSSSPWQMYEPLAEFCETEQFPAGSFHLRSFRLRDHMIRRLLLLRRPGKHRVIKRIIRQFPRRQFVLVGDSSEHDAEIYGALARKFPDQVAAIFIRQIPNRALSEAQRAKAFRGVSPEIWTLYHDANELPNSLEEAAEPIAG